MDKTMFRGYVRELVREEVEAQVRKLLPKLLDEAIQEVKTLTETSISPISKKQPALSRDQLAARLGLESLGEGTIVARTDNIVVAPPGREDDPVVAAINKNYSSIMKKMGMSK